MAYLFHQDELPKMVSVTPGRERIFFVSPELAGTETFLAGIIRYKRAGPLPTTFMKTASTFIFSLMERK